MVQRLDATETGMANIALGHLRKPSIESIDGTAKPAVEIRRHFAAVRDGLQAQYPWNFCDTAESLPADSGSGFPKYAYAFTLPVDCLCAVSVGDEDVDNRFRVVAGHRLLTDCPPPLVVRYRKRVPEVAYWPPLFVNAFCLHLAVAAGGVLTTDENLLTWLAQQAQASLLTAFPVDAAEGMPDALPTSAWVACR